MPAFMARRGIPGWKPSPLVKLLRRPIVFWSILVLLIAATVVLSNLGEDVDPDADPERLIEVPVAQRLILPGETFEEDAVAWELRPAKVLPDGIADNLDEDDMAAVAIYPGEEVLTARLKGGRGLSGRIPPGTAALSFPKTAEIPPVSTGDRVRIFASSNLDANGLEGAAHAVSVAAEAWVVEVDAESVTVAVSPQEAAAAVVPKQNGTLTLAALAARRP